MRRLPLLAFALLALVAAGCAGTNRPLAPASPQDQLRMAKLRYEQNDYTEAIALLTGYIQYHADAPDLDEAHFLLGMTHVHRKEWPLAAGEFVTVTSDYPDSPRLPDAHYWLGLSYWRQARPAVYDQDPTRRALAQWQRFLNLYPDHPKAAEARALQLEGRARLAEKSVRNGKLYLVLKQYKPALVYFDEVLRDYADTRWVDWARVGRGEALRGQGKTAEARAALDAALPGLKDAEARERARELLEKLPPVTQADGAEG
jgi:outer membrane protein assembly factor BamD